MRILLAHHGYGRSVAGAQTMARALATELTARGHEVCMLTAGGEDADGERFPVPVVSLAASAASGLARALPWRPDLVHAVDLAHARTAAMAGVLARALSVPFLVTPATEASLWEDRKAGMALCREADTVVLLTASEMATLRAGGVLDQHMELMPQAPWLCGLPDPVGFRARHGLEGAIVLFCGRKAGFKGYRELLDATPLVWRRLPGVSFVFVGPSWDDDAGAVFAHHADPRVIDLGVVDEQEKHSAFAACDLLCAPSSLDVFPLVITEAWACSKPVVVGPFPGSSELIADGVDGVVTDGRAPSLARAIVAILSRPDRLAAMGRAGGSKAREMTWESVAGRHEALYGRLIGAGKCTP